MSGMGCALLALLLLSQNAPPPAFRKAQELQRKEAWVEAERAYRAFLESEPRNIAGLTNLGIVLARQGLYAEAIESYRKALAVNPSLRGVQTNLAIAYFQSGDFAKAAEWLRKLLAVSPADRRVAQLLAISEEQLGNYAEALALFERLLPSEEPSVLIGAAHAYLETGRPGKADLLLEQLVKSQPGSPQVLLLTGLSAYKREDFDRASSTLKQLTETDPQNAEGRFWLASSMLRQGRAEEAIAEWRALIRDQPNHFAALLALGTVLTDRAEWTGAKPLLAQACELRPSSAEARFEYGRALSQAKENDAALAELQAAAKLDPTSQRTSFLLANTLRSLGREEEALAEFQRSRALSPKR
jgi:tetratricopeptide (TPR) repeat protein